jgi:hypothetical protein
MQKKKNTRNTWENQVFITDISSQEREVRIGRDENPVQREAEDSNFISVHLSLHFSVSDLLDRPLDTVFIFQKWSMFIPVSLHRRRFKHKAINSRRHSRKYCSYKMCTVRFPSSNMDSIITKNNRVWIKDNCVTPHSFGFRVWIW